MIIFRYDAPAARGKTYQVQKKISLQNPCLAHIRQQAAAKQYNRKTKTSGFSFRTSATALCCLHSQRQQQHQTHQGTLHSRVRSSATWSEKQIVDFKMPQQRSWMVVGGSATALLLLAAISHHVVPGVDGHAYLMKPHSRQYLMSRVFKEE